MPPTVLIVDDEPDVRDVLVDFFTPLGYTIEVAASGAAALAVIRERRPNVVLLDLNLPGALSGLDVLRAIAGGVPAIMITGNVDAERGRATLAAGAFDYVAKPIDLHYLEIAVAAAVAYSQREGEGDDAFM